MLTRLRTYIFVYFLFGFYIITFLPQLFNVDINYVIIFYRISVVTFAILILVANKQYKKKTVFLLSLLSFWGFYLIKVFFYTNFTNQNFNLPPNYFYFYSIGIVILPMMVFYSQFDNVPSFKLLVNSFYLVLIASILSFVFNLGSLLAGVTRIAGNENLSTLFYGYFAVVMLILSFFVLYHKRIPFLLGVSAMGIGFTNLVLAGSRGPFVSFLLLTLLVIFVLDRNKRHKSIKIFVSTILFIVIVIYIYNQSQLVLVERFLHSFDNLDNARAQTRIFLWKEAYFEFTNNIVLGGSIELPQNAIYPHQILLEILMSTGLLGFILFIVPFFRAIKTAIVLLKEKNSYAWVGILYINFFIMMMFSFSMISVGMSWYLMVFMLSFNEKKMRG